MGVLTIIGNHISPFVRKVLATCEIKGLAYRIDSIVPFFGGDRFATGHKKQLVWWPSDLIRYANSMGTHVYKTSKTTDAGFVG